MVVFCSASVDYRWYESVSPESPSSPVEQQVYYREPTAGVAAPAHYPPQHPPAFSRSTGMSAAATSAAPNVYNLNTFPLPNGQDRATVGLLSSYPVAAQSHHHHHNHHQPHHHHVKHYSEQGSTLPPQHHHQQQTRQSLQYHSHTQRGSGVNGGAMPEEERLRRMSSPEMQMQLPPQRAPRGTHRIHSSASSNSTHYSKVVFNERGKQVHQQRRNNDVKYRERPASIGSHGARRTTNYQRMTAQRSEGSLPYNSLDRGMIFNRDGGSIDPTTLSPVQEHEQQYQPQQQGGEWAPHHFSPSGSRSEMRSPISEQEMDDPGKAYDLLEGYQNNGFAPAGEHQHQVNAEEQR